MDSLWSNIIFPALESKATTTLIALAAAIAAFSIYFMRRRDNKKDAANIILLEIKNAERNLGEAQKAYEDARAKDPDRIDFPEKLRLMSTESWTKYKYLFIRDLTPEQWDEISKFYENCRNFDEAVEVKDSSFAASTYQIRVNINRNAGNYAKELADKLEPNPNESREVEKQNQKLLDDYTQKSSMARRLLLEKFAQEYGPDKPFWDAAYYYNLLPASITNTPTGQRLKALADRRIMRIKKTDR